MPVKKHKPITPGQRHYVKNTNSELTSKSSKPYKKLTVGTKKSGGRNHDGKMTVRNIGGGHKRKYRIIDFKRDNEGVRGEVMTIEYDPPGKGAQLARSAGTSATLMGREGKYAIIRLPSGEVRKVLLTCKATIGTTSNPDHGLTVMGKAGRNRWKGNRPRVRGVAMNPVDHPMDSSKLIISKRKTNNK